MKRAVIYARVSTKEQDANFSIPSQIEGAKEYARKNDMEVIGVFHEDASGMKYPRPKLEIALQTIEEGQAEIVICHTDDRLNRHEINGFLIRKRISDAKGELHYTLTGPCDLGDEYRMFAMIKDAVAADEVRRISERMGRGRRYKAKTGAWIGLGAPPYGYRVVGERRETRLEVHEEEARWVRQIFHWYVVDKISVRKIVRRLSDAGVERPGVSRQNPTAKAKASQWNDSTIYHILKNTTYIGRFYSHRYNERRTPQGRIKTERPRDEWLEIATPVIIDEGIFNKAQVRLANGKSDSFKNRKYEYMLTTRLYCSLCGFKIAPHPGAYGKYLYYRCRSHEWRIWGQKCDLLTFDATQVDAVVWACIKELLEHPESLRRSVEEANGKAREDHAHIYGSITSIEAEIKHQEARLQKAVFLYLETGDDDQQRFIRETARKTQEEINGLLIKLHHERDLLSRRVTEIQVSAETIAVVEEFADGLRAQGNLDELDVNERRAVVEALGATGVLAVENEQRVIYLTVLLQTQRLVIDSEDVEGESTESHYHKHNLKNLPSLTFRLVIAA